jgi:hypothetical protein
VIPLYCFLEGDTIGLLLLADPEETVGALAERLQDAASLRVARKPRVKVVASGKVLDLRQEVGAVPLGPLDLIHVLDDGG